MSREIKSRKIKPIISKPMTNVIAKQGERIFELAITDYKEFDGPLFEPGFLGDKWPAVDYYVELREVADTTPFFFVQIKSTADPWDDNTKSIAIHAPKKKCKELFKLPGPTYIVGIHVPTGRAFITSLHKPPTKGVYRIPLVNELNSENLKRLHSEVAAFWKSVPHKPRESQFK